MIHAVFFLVNGRAATKSSHRRMNARQYEWLKTHYNNALVGRHHSDESRMKTRQTMIKNGISGKRTWLHKGDVVKYVLNSKVDEFLKNGFSHGRPGYKPRSGMQGRKIK